MRKMSPQSLNTRAVTSAARLIRGLVRYVLAKGGAPHAATSAVQQHTIGSGGSLPPRSGGPIVMERQYRQRRCHRLPGLQEPERDSVGVSGWFDGAEPYLVGWPGRYRTGRVSFLGDRFNKPHGVAGGQKGWPRASAGAACVDNLGVCVRRVAAYSSGHRRRSPQPYESIVPSEFTELETSKSQPELDARQRCHPRAFPGAPATRPGRRTWLETPSRRPQPRAAGPSPLPAPFRSSRRRTADHWCWRSRACSRPRTPRAWWRS
jgi:hypothetical protein